MHTFPRYSSYLLYPHTSDTYHVPYLLVDIPQFSVVKLKKVTFVSKPNEFVHRDELFNWLEH